MAAKHLKTLTEAQARVAQEMYEEVDGRGRKVWSMMRLADHFGVGETTIYRAVNRLGSYRHLPAVMPPADSPEMQQMKAASLAKLQGLLKEPAEGKQTAADVFLETGRIIDPLNEE